MPSSKAAVKVKQKDGAFVGLKTDSRHFVLQYHGLSAKSVRSPSCSAGRTQDFLHHEASLFVHLEDAVSRQQANVTETATTVPQTANLPSRQNANDEEL